MSAALEPVETQTAGFLRKLSLHAVLPQQVCWRNWRLV